MKFLFFLLVVFFWSCDPHRNEFSTIRGYVPVYASQQVVNTMEAVPSRPTARPGKIYAYNQYLFQVEQGEGIHIIDNTDPAHAHKVAFLTITGCSEIAIQSGFLYSNHLAELVVFDLQDAANPRLVNRISNAFPDFSQSYPPFTGAYFECPDPAKGMVIGWEEQELHEPKCRR